MFDIQQGVAIGIFAKEQGKTSPATVHYADFWGLREGKYETLVESDINTTEWTKLQPSSPYYLFVKRDETNLEEYMNGWQVTDIFPVNGVGITTARDDFVFDFDDKALRSRIEEFRQTSLSDDEIREKYKLKENQSWRVSEARAEIRRDDDFEKAFTKCLYRPFDIRPLFYHKTMMERSRLEVMRHMLAGENLGLVSARSNKSPEMNHFFCSRFIMETKCGESTTQSCLFPLYLYPAEGKCRLMVVTAAPTLTLISSRLSRRSWG